MKKLFVFLCLLFPYFAFAQDYKTLKRTADSLRKEGDYQKAEPLYTEAINRVTTYQEKVSNHQWVELCLAAQQNHIKAFSYTDDKTATFINWEYGPDGPKFKQKISDLIKDKAKLIFTYGTYPGFAVDTYMFGDSISRTRIGFTPANRRILFWITADDTYFMQAFSDLNIYEPLKTKNKAFVNFIKLYQNELPYQSIPNEHLKDVEGPVYTFRFYTADNVWVKGMHDAYNLVDPAVANNIALYKLLPLVKQMVKSYDVW